MVLLIVLIMSGSVAAENAYEDVHGKGISITHAYVLLNITNEPPRIVSLQLGKAYEDTEILCSASSTDRENDAVGYYYKWYRNNERLDFSQQSLPSQYFSANDVVMCEATPYDHETNGSSAIAATKVNKVPFEVRAVKTALSAVGIKASTSEVAEIASRGMLATTGFVVGEVRQSTGATVGLLAVAIAFLLVLNINLILRLSIGKLFKHRD
jgi:hypothetical protein